MDDGKTLFLLYALKIGALELLPEGRQLKSGRISPYFFNSGLFKTGRDLAVLAQLYANTITQQIPEIPDVIFGPAYKGIPLATSVAMTLCDTAYDYVNVGWAFNRKEAKDHGEGGIIVGCDLKDKKVLIIDDVITTGSSIEESIDIIREAGGTAVRAVVGFDRQERGTDSDMSAIQCVSKQSGITIVPSVTLDDLIHCLAQGDYLVAEEMLPKIQMYKNEYGC